MSPDTVPMRSVYKYQLELGINDIKMPSNAKVVHFATQAPDICVWMEVVRLEPDEVRRFDVIGTGHRIAPNYTHRGTLQSGSFVWHLYELEATE